MSHLTRRRAVYGLLFVLFVPMGTACISWKPVELAPVPASDSVPSRTVRVVTHNGSRLTLRDAQVRNDPLHARNVSVPMADVAAVRAQTFRGIKTAVLVA